MSSNHQRPITHQVYRRPAPRGIDPAINGEETGWQFAPALNCTTVTLTDGPVPGSAQFGFIPLDASMDALGKLIAEYGVDDQVRVVIQPHTTPESADVPSDKPGLILFEGLLVRSSFAIAAGSAAANTDSETVTFSAIPITDLDDSGSGHVILGRWVYNVDDPATSALIESPSIAAVFNPESKPNQSPDRTINAAGAAALVAPVFTHDDDAAAVFWSPRTAIASILARWLYGDDVANPLPRNTAIEAATLVAITATTSPAEARWIGIDKPLPSVDVTGMGPLSAVHAVCEAAGFAMALVPQVAHDADSETLDRLYALTIYRADTGAREIDLLLPKRGEFPDDASLVMDACDVSSVQGMWDTSGVVTEVAARGRALIETSVELLPLWSPDDVANDELTAELRRPPSQVLGSAYQQRHVAGGDEFAAYGHVGRMWGIDCDGSLAAGLYASPSAYAHSADGFDWLTSLGLGGGDAITADRTAAGITEPLVMTRRLRLPLPLGRAEAHAAGLEYVLEVSEDAGANWVLAPVRYSVLNDQFAIRLGGSDIGNLARISLATIGTSTDPAIADSWWALIGTENLRMRLTCRIEADFAMRVDLPRRNTAASVYKRTTLLTTAAQETWAQPDSFFNATNNFVRVPEYKPAADRADLQDQALVTQDAGHTLRFSANAGSWIMHLDKWRVGDAVRGITGRDVSFQSSHDNPARFPTIQTVEVVLSPESAQGINIDITDRAFSRGTGGPARG